MLTIKIDEEELLRMLTDRVENWTDNYIDIALYEDMYDNYVYGGGFDGAEVNIMQIVDNDWVNYCEIIHKDENNDTWKEINACYEENGLGECSCEEYGDVYIEAENDGNYLIRV